MKNLLLILLFTCLGAINSSGQNLVMNGSFENVNFNSCGITDDFAEILMDWDSPNASAGDVYFTDISQDCYNYQPNSTYSGPIGFKGSELPSDGAVFAGIWVYTIEGQEQREYARGRLSDPLVVGSTYRVKLKISLADYMESSVGELGIAFLESQQVQTSGSLVLDEPQLLINSGLEVYDGWVEFDTTFVSDSNYEFFIIGNFKSDSDTETFANPNASGAVSTYGAYYYIDEVSVELETVTAIEAKDRSQITVYPNPVIDNLSFKVEGSPINSFGIFNLLGEKVREVSLNAIRTGTIECASLKPGIYFLVGYDAWGNASSRLKFVRVD